MTKDLTGRVVVITGGARGIGFTTATQLAAAGATVVLGDLDLDQVTAAAAAVGHGAVGARLDVTSRESWTEFLEETASAGPIDVLVNNAGIMPIGRFLDEDDAISRAVMDVNVLGYGLGMKLVVPGMIARGGGQVVNVASAVGRLPLAEGASYSGSKAAVIAMSEAIRDELQHDGIDISVILPTAVETALAAGISHAKGVKHLAPEDVAEAIVGVIRRPRDETWVPRSGGRAVAASALLPRAVRLGLQRLISADTVLSSADRSARVAYEQEVREKISKP
ncbi:SDR family oxidoreductase [Aeromicrobium fastidiosum]|uniref:SDR family oxidoreductase n=1 Tax=Aeromicrobium fastidiosum TaxID=52699 RepID=A0A641AR14_9ACTN|nr:SDR family oxidoreductase [Aeromicrobium fastidiosum]KAA1378522.1 SDR family oxidoreductase [Aeromicrobium fastidiosum]MBP2392509.1 NADP-dependent 3-hydroxy acid dehydrogenase YdfG [Aeromicrobium fastidiosum]